MMNKRAYMKTLEAIIAAMILLIFIAEVLPKEVKDTSLTPAEIETTQQTILDAISLNESLRSCVLNENRNCIISFIDGVIKPTLSYNFTVTNLSSPLEIPYSPSKKPAYIKTRIIAANFTENDPKIVKLNVWSKI